jgi:superfamily II DNA/RNA helicase
VAENFIHRVGRTGRAGKQGIASTLFVKEQRSDLFQLERALGIRIEKMRADGIPAAESRDRNRGNVVRGESTPRPRMVQLPGEVLQAQMQS